MGRFRQVESIRVSEALAAELLMKKSWPGTTPPAADPVLADFRTGKVYEWLLVSGAKLLFSLTTGFQVHGYTWEGSDIEQILGSYRVRGSVKGNSPSFTAFLDYGHPGSRDVARFLTKTMAQQYRRVLVKRGLRHVVWGFDPKAELWIVIPR